MDCCIWKGRYGNFYVFRSNTPKPIVFGETFMPFLYEVYIKACISVCFILHL